MKSIRAVAALVLWCGLCNGAWAQTTRVPTQDVKGLTDPSGLKRYTGAVLLYRDDAAYDEVRFPAPVFIGDTLNVETEVFELRESKSRPNAGIVTFIHRAYNQNGVLVGSCKRTGLQMRKPAA